MQDLAHAHTHTENTQARLNMIVIVIVIIIIIILQEFSLNFCMFRQVFVFLGYFAHSRRAQYFVYLMFTVRYFVFFYFEIFVPATTIARTTCRRLASSI